MRVLLELARVEKHNVERLVVSRAGGEDVKVPEVGGSAGRGRAHLEAVEVARLGEVLDADGAVGVDGLEVERVHGDARGGGWRGRAEDDARQGGQLGDFE